MNAQDLDELAVEVEGAAVPTPISPWSDAVEDGAAIMEEELPPVVEIIAGIAAEQSKLVIASGSKSFKTWVTMDASLSISHGVDFWGRKTARRVVLYVNLELKPVTFKRRLQIIARNKGIVMEPGRFHVLHLRGQLSGLTPFEIFNRLIETAKQFKADVVVLDPIYKLNLQGDENSSRDQTLLYNEIDRLTTTAGCTVILNDHFGKGNQSEKDPLDAIRGSSAKGGDVDAALVMRRHEAENCFRVDMVHRELAPVAPFVVGWKFPLMTLRSELNPDAMKKAKAGRHKAHDPKMLLASILNTSDKNPISITAWADAAGVPRNTLASYLPEMRSKGWVSTVGEGSNARQFLTAQGRETVERFKGEA